MDFLNKLNKSQITKLIKGRRKIIKMYKSFCVDCQLKAKIRPNRPYEDYCDICREKAKTVLKGVMK